MLRNLWWVRSLLVPEFLLLYLAAVACALLLVAFIYYIDKRSSESRIPVVQDVGDHESIPIEAAPRGYWRRLSLCGRAGMFALTVAGVGLVLGSIGFTMTSTWSVMNVALSLIIIGGVEILFVLPPFVFVYALERWEHRSRLR